VGGYDRSDPKQNQDCHDPAPEPKEQSTATGDKVKVEFDNRHFYSCHSHKPKSSMAATRPLHFHDPSGCNTLTDNPALHAQKDCR
jgi:hypothetical protein